MYVDCIISGCLPFKLTTVGEVWWPLRWWFLSYILIGLKTLWEKETMLVKSIFSFSLNVFKMFFFFYSGSLTLYHRIPTVNNPEKEAFWKQYGKRRKCWLPAFSHFLTMFSTLPKTNFISSLMFILLSANASDLDQSENLLFWKELTFSQTSPGIYVSEVQIFRKLCGKRRNCSWWAISTFPTVFSTHL